jgi:hypothetical protein
MNDEGAPKNVMALGPFGPMAGLSQALQKTDRKNIAAIVAIRVSSAGLMRAPLSDRCEHRAPGFRARTAQANWTPTDESRIPVMGGRSRHWKGK